MKVSSPCIGICKLNPNNLCIGCYRTSTEIANWNSLSDEHKYEIKQKAKIRRMQDNGEQPKLSDLK